MQYLYIINMLIVTLFVFQTIVLENSGWNIQSYVMFGTN